MTALTLAEEQLHALFPFHLVLTPGLHLERAGRVLARLYAGLRPGTRLESHFALKRPRGQLSYEQLVRSVGRLVVLEHIHSPLLLRGQIVVLESERLMFVGSPWFTSLADLEQVGLRLSDLPAHDSATDLLFVLQGKETALQELRALTERLEQQRYLLRRSNRLLEVQQAALRALAQASDVRTAAGGMAQALGDAVGWISSTLWLVDGDSLRPAFRWPARARGHGCRRLAEQACRTGEPQRAGEAWSCPSRATGACQEGCDPIEPYAIPIQVDGGITGVVTFGGGEPPDRGLEQVLVGLAHQFGRFTARVRTETALAETRARHSAIIDAALDCIVSIDQHGTIVEFNPAAERVFGWKADEIVGQPLAEVLIPPRYRGAHLEGMRLHLESGRVSALGRRVELHAMRRDGTELPVELSLSRIPTPDGPSFTGQLRDLTEQYRVQGELERAREAAEASNRAKSEFLATVSHEIRTPMNAILGMTSLAIEGDSSVPTEVFLRRVLANAESLLRLLNDMLDVSKIEAGHLDLEELPLRPLELAGEVVAAFEDRAREKGVALRLEPGPGLPPVVLGDPTRLRQVLMNLLSNAMKFTSEGAVRLRLERVEAEAGAQLHFAVADTGIGIGEADQARVFEKFVQSDSSTTRRFGGTGLGLAICRSLVEKMGGDITLRSQEGVGSTFTVELPLREAQVEESAPPVAPAPEPLVGAVRVLVAEDNPDNARLFQRTLDRAGYQVDLVVNGREAVEAAAQRPYNLILLDLDMPEVDGFEATRRIRAAEKEGGRTPVPIVAVSAHAMVGVEERCLEAGMDDYLAKPIMPRALRKAVPDFLDRRPLVLVVDDSPDNRLLHSTFLQRSGVYRVWCAASGHEALSMMTRMEPALVLLDMEMPGMNGYQVVRALREQPERARLPVVAITGSLGPEAERACLEAGCDAYLAKPIRRASLLRMVRSWVGASSPG